MQAMATVDLLLSAEKCEDLLKQGKEKVKMLRDWKDREEGGTANFEEGLGETNSKRSRDREKGTGTRKE